MQSIRILIDLELEIKNVYRNVCSDKPDSNVHIVLMRVTYYIIIFLITMDHDISIFTKTAIFYQANKFDIIRNHYP